MNEKQNNRHISIEEDTASGVRPAHAVDSPSAHEEEKSDGGAADNAALPSTDGPSSQAGKPPVSERKLEANRKNAQKSTGPRTESGKAKAAANSYRHGFFALRLFLNMDQFAKEKEAYESVANGFYQHYQPVGHVEKFLVEKIATESLRFARLIGHEQIVLSWRSPFESRSANNLQRYQATINRQLFQAIEELERQQAKRKAEETPTVQPIPAEEEAAEESEEPTAAPDGPAEELPTDSVATATEPRGEQSEPPGSETAPGENSPTDTPLAEAGEAAVSSSQAHDPSDTDSPPQSESEGTNPRLTLADLLTEEELDSSI